MSKKFTANTFQTPNFVIDSLMRDLPDGALCVYLVVLRKTAGFHKSEDKISITQFMKATGKSKSTLLKILGELEKYGLITRDSRRGYLTTYSIVDRPDLSEIENLKEARKAESLAAKDRQKQKQSGIPDGSGIRDLSSPEFEKDGSGIPDPTKDHLTTKPNNTKKGEAPFSPDPKILSGLVTTECTGHCNYEHPCNYCKPRKKLAKSVARELADIFQKSKNPPWKKYLQRVKWQTIAECYFAMEVDICTATIACDIQRELATGGYNDFIGVPDKEKPFVSAAVEDAIIRVTGEVSV